jgi:RNase adaptor protein for sRNA GlmZ degradation
MQRLIIIRGNSGSGKSTVAKQLQYKMGYETMLIPQDVVRREMLRVKDEEDNPSINLVYDLAMYGNKIGFDVIVEGIFVTERYGDMLKKLINDVPIEVTLERHVTKPNSHEFGEKEIREWWVEKDYLGVPQERMITADLSKDEILEMFVKDMKI